MKKFCISIIAVALSLCFADISLRNMHYPLKPYTWNWAVIGILTPDKNRIYAITPYAKGKESAVETIDPYGFRTNPGHTVTSTSKKTIMVFGDSFVYGYKMNDNETFPSVTQKILDSRNIPIDIINAGVPGYGPDQTYEYIRETIRIYKPNTIVWFINVNDIRDSNYACLYTKNIFGNYMRLPIYLQTLYLQGIIVKKSPDFIRTSPIINIAMQSLQHGPERRTIGCTIDENDPRTLSRGIDKLAYFINALKTETRDKQIQVRYVLLPAEYYFSTTLSSNDSQEMKTYYALRDLLAKTTTSFVDMNEAFATHMAPDMVSIRSSRMKHNSYMTISAPDTNILGVSGTNTKNLFLANDGEPGFRHLNQLGNRLLGTLFAHTVISDYD